MTESGFGPDLPEDRNEWLDSRLEEYAELAETLAPELKRILSEGIPDQLGHSDWRRFAGVVVDHLSSLPNQDLRVRILASYSDLDVAGLLNCYFTFAIFHNSFPLCVLSQLVEHDPRLDAASADEFLTLVLVDALTFGAAYPEVIREHLDETAV
jgi:hypothetical protein